MNNHIESTSNRSQLLEEIGKQLTQSDLKTLMEQAQDEGNFNYQSSENKPNLFDTSSVFGNISDALKKLPAGSDILSSSLDLSSKAGELKDLTLNLEMAARDLKNEHKNAAVSEYAAAASKVDAAAEQVRLNPTSEKAIEEFETAVDELKNKALALEGEIGEKQYSKIASAVKEFETATDHMLGADDGEADMAGAISDASDALELLNEATSGKTQSDQAYSDLNKLGNKLNSSISKLMDAFNIEDKLAELLEDVTEQLQDAIRAFIDDPTDEDNIENLVKSAGTFEKLTTDLKGKIDEDSYQNISKVAASFKESTDKLLGKDGNQSEVDKVVPEITQSLEKLVAGVSDGISNVETMDTNIQKFREMLDKMEADAKGEDIGSVSKAEVQEILAEIEKKDELAQAVEDLKLAQTGKDLEGILEAGNISKAQIQEILAELEKNELWQGPLIVDAADLNDIFNPKTLTDMANATDALETITKDLDTYNIPELTAFKEDAKSLNTAAKNLKDDPSLENAKAFHDAAIQLQESKDGLKEVLDETTFSKLDAAVNNFETAVDVGRAYSENGDSDQVDKQIADATNGINEIAKIVGNAKMIDSIKNAMADLGEVPIKDNLKPKTLADLENVTNDLETLTRPLDNSEITELAAFEDATVRVKTDLEAMLKDPSPENIEKFAEAAEDLNTAVSKLERVLDTETFEKLRFDTDTFMNSVNLAIEFSQDGNTDEMNKQITIATNSLQGVVNTVVDTYKEAMEV